MNIIKKIFVILFLFLMQTSFAQDNIDINKLQFNDTYKEEFYNYFKDKSVLNSYNLPAYEKLFLIMKNNNSFSDEEIGAFLYDSPIIKINDEYFDDLSKLELDKIDKTAKIEIYNKNIFYSVDELKKYEESKKAQGKDSFSDYKEYAKFNQKAKQTASFYIHDDFSVSKDDFEIFELIKDKDYISQSDKIKIALGSSAIGCVTFNPKYYPKDTIKVEKVLNNSKIKDENKAKEIQNRLKYFPKTPSVGEVIKDTAGRIYYIGGMLVTSTVAFAYPWGINMMDNASKMMIQYKLW